MAVDLPTKFAGFWVSACHSKQCFLWGFCLEVFLDFAIHNRNVEINNCFFWVVGLGLFLVYLGFFLHMVPWVMEAFQHHSATTIVQVPDPVSVETSL